MGCRPSSLLGIEDDVWASYMLDNCVVLFGTSLEAAMSEAASGKKNNKAKQQASLLTWGRWLDVPQEELYKGSSG